MTSPGAFSPPSPQAPPRLDTKTTSAGNPRPTNTADAMPLGIPPHKSSTSTIYRSPPSVYVPPESSPLSPGATDRVYPIRSAINIEPRRASSSTSSASLSGPGGDELFARSPSQSTISSSIGMALSQAGSATSARFPGGPAEAVQSSRKSSIAEEGLQISAPVSEQEYFHTRRHEHVATEDGHMIVTGLVGGVETLQRCEDEPIHIPGAVQGYGCLIALKESEDGASLDVRIVSENSKEILGYTPAELFRRGNFCSLLSDEQADNLLDHIDFLREDTDVVIDGPEVFSITVTGPDAVNIRLWCALHRPEENPDLFILEFELEEDNKFPLIPVSNTPSEAATPEDTLGSAPTGEEYAQSTTSMSRPLRALRPARRRRGEAAAMEVFNLMSQVQEQLASAMNLDDLCRIVCGLVKELSGFHRVMIYQFDELWNGKVIAELFDPRATRDLFKGLHFPASDIPAQARELYRINKVRLLYDRDLPTARLVCKTQEDIQKPLDLKHSCLRAMSPIHLKYLANMAVRASMSISITAFGTLWGLISCHSYGPDGTRVSFPIRKMCRVIGESASRNIERLNYARRLHARKLINTVPTEQNPGGYIVASSDDLLRLFDADAGLLSIRDETKVLGKLDDSQEALAMLEYLRMRNFTTVIVSQDLAADFPDLIYEPGFRSIAGLLLVPLSTGCDDFIVFLRKPELRNVHWAGNPYEKVVREGSDAFLEPRKSFQIWSETVVGRSREWTEEQIETAAVLCLVYGKFIEVWRQKEAALKNSQLTRLLLANASHEVRTPLNAIINYLEIALEAPLDKETRDNLTRSHAASKSLIYVINDLLDLTRAEGGNMLHHDEVFNLRQTISNATEMFESDAKRKGLAFETIEYPGVPDRVIGDPTRLRQIVSNLAGNAVRHTVKGGITVEIRTSSYKDDDCHIEIAVQDTGEGMSPSKLDALFREFEQCQADEDDPVLQSEKDMPDQMPAQKILGLGLAVVARTIRNMNGQLRLKSEEGKGSRFTVIVPLKIPLKGSISPPHPKNPEIPESDGVGQGVTLVPGRLSHRGSQGMMRRRSSTGSNHSTKSTKTNESNNSSTSTIDRMVQCLSTPHLSSPGLEKPQIHLPSRPASATFPSSGKSVPTLSPAVAQAVRESALPDACRSLPVPSGAIVPRNYAVPSSSAQPTLPKVPEEGKFAVLVAEDDPINSKIVKKRLERMGHDVMLTVNGKECFEAFGQQGGKQYDAVLMDMQMPIMDGGTSASCIRKHEHRFIHKNRIPIFAVSASLVEEQKAHYCQLGFDGWILKPVDFGRLALLLEGIRTPSVRRDAQYVPGKWERGGWFYGSAEERILYDSVGEKML